MTAVSNDELVSEHKVRLDAFAPKNILMVVGNPAISTTLAWPVGSWMEELAHPFY